ncbi:MAG: NAD(P)H-hydrate dehydratase [Clostridia bacterium]|nr:NAD(P)H-hydrate dehydratase [Clostridia bacterium]
MEWVLSNAEMRAADSFTIENLGISGGQLMKAAGKAIADEVEKAAKKLNVNDITVICGTGNNGGDGYICAEELKNRGYKVDVCDRYLQHITGAIVVDCIFGTGLCREVTGEYAEIIDKINNSGAYVISADIPSGLNGNNGRIMGCAVRADLTVAIAEYKLGMFLNDGPDYCGEIIKKDIGISLPESSYAFMATCRDISEFYPKRPRNSHKGSYGSANLVAGSHKYIGAAALSTEAALKSGCGYVKLTSAERVINALAPKFPQAIYLDAPDLSSDAIAIGMGCGATEVVYETIKKLLTEYSGNLLIDADGLNALAKFGADILKTKKCSVILTPHVKEFSRLSGIPVEEILNDPVAVTKSFAKEYGVTLVLKSATTVICDGEKTALNVTGNTALAKGGSGDMLSGYLCGTLARGVKPFEAALCSAFALGKAAEIAAAEKTEYCATAKDILKNLHISVKRLTH